MADIGEMSQRLSSHIIRTSKAYWPGATLLEVVDGSAQWTDGYVWCSLAGATVRCFVPSTYDVSGGSQIIYGIPIDSGTTADYLCVGVSYNGTDDGRIPRTRTTYIQSGSDLPIACGTGHTFYLVNPVYNDLQFAVSQGKVPASNAPNWEAFTTNTSEFAFDVNEYIDLAANEVPHGWVEGSVVDFHLHCAIKAANSAGASRYAKFTAYVAYVNISGIWAETPLSGEITILNEASALQSYYCDLGDLDLTGFKLGSMLKVNIKRIAATGGTEYASSVFISQVGTHVKQDTLGSRQEASK